MASPLLASLTKASGVHTVLRASRDVKLLFFQRFVRLFAYGTSFIIIVNFLKSLQIADTHVGWFMTLTMLGDVVISLVLSLITDQVGRRKVLIAGALLMASSGVTMAMSSTFWILLLASVFGVISPAGNEIGPFRAVEESILAQLTDKDDRSDILAWYTMCGTAGTALGTGVSGWLVHVLSRMPNWTELSAYRAVFVLYSLLGLVKLVLTSRLSSGVELKRIGRNLDYREAFEMEDEDLLSDSSSESEWRYHRASLFPEVVMEQPRQTTDSRILGYIRSLLPHISRRSLSVLWRLVYIFAIDAFAYGLSSPSWLTYFFTTYHHVTTGPLGTLFFMTNVLATLLTFAALPLVRRFGVVKAMVLTHLPSAIFLGLMPLPNSSAAGTWMAMALLSLWGSAQWMDQAPRQAFLVAVVKNEERTAVLGVINIVKTIGQAGGIGIAGIFAQKKLWVIMLSGAGLMKVVYDVLIICTFLGVKDREDEERERKEEVTRV